MRTIAQCVERGEMIPFELRDLHLVSSFRRAAAAYEPRPWSGRATLFRAAETAYIYRLARPAYGWDRDIPGGLEIVAIEGDHHTLMRPDNVGPLARALDVAIEGAAGAHLRGVR
jgi:hypothetical protein